MNKSVALFSILLVLVALGLWLYLQVNVSGFLSAPKLATATLANTSNLATATASDPFDPAKFGLPPTLAGYTVLAVLTPDNTVCMAPGTKILVLQDTHPFSSQMDLSYLRAREAAITADLDKRGLSEYNKVDRQFVGSSITRDQYLSYIPSRNAQRGTYGCVTSVPAPPTAVK
jgi:hypothetical protein